MKRPRRAMTDLDDGENGSQKHWHVSRNIPVAFIVTMVIYAVVQTATAAWFASAMNFRVETLEKAQVIAAPQGERITRVEEKLISIDKGVTRIEALLTKPVNR